MGALQTNTEGNYNSAFGAYALGRNDSQIASFNSAFGYQSLYTNSTGQENTAFGYLAMYSNTTGGLNTAVGNGSLASNISGAGNVAVGVGTLSSVTTTANNVGIGKNAGYFLTGTENVAIGYAAGPDGTVLSNYNVFIGSSSGSNLRGTNNIMIGFASQGAAAGDSNEIVIGTQAVGLGSNTVTIGNDSVVLTRLKGSLTLDKTITAGATTGAQTINKTAGSVNFAAAATSLVVTNSIVTTSSVIICTIGTNDATMTSVRAVASAGSFTIHATASATAETRVNFLVIN